MVRSLRSRLRWWLGAAVCGLTLLQCATVFLSALHEADELFDLHLQQMALTLHGEGRFDSVTAMLRRQPADEDEFQFAIRVRSRARVQTYEPMPHPPFPEQPAPGFSTLGSGSQAWRLFTLQSDDTSIEVAQPMSLRQELALDFSLRSLAPALLVLPLLLLFVGWAVHRALQPLEALTHELEHRTATRLDSIDAAPVLPEMVPVVRSMNGLLARMRAAFAAQRAFVADAAHELRSPLTVLKLQAQLLGRASDEAARSTAQARLEAGVDRAVQLTEQLLALAREESAALQQRGDDAHCVREAVCLALNDVASLAEARAVTVDLAHDAEPARVHASPEAMRLMARNLLDNAIRHAPRGSRIEARIAGDAAGAVELAIDDAGPGIAPAERERVFDRFYRGENAAAGGSGLGLSIVRAIAERSGAQVRLEQSPLGGLRVRVRFAVAGTPGAA